MLLAGSPTSPAARHTAASSSSDSTRSRDRSCHFGRCSVGVVSRRSWPCSIAHANNPDSADLALLAETSPRSVAIWRSTGIRSWR